MFPDYIECCKPNTGSLGLINDKSWIFKRKGNGEINKHLIH
jgi:hypothetical protein